MGGGRRRERAYKARMLVRTSWPREGGAAGPGATARSPEAHRVTHETHAILLRRHVGPQVRRPHRPTSAGPRRAARGKLPSISRRRDRRFAHGDRAARDAHRRGRSGVAWTAPARTGPRDLSRHRGLPCASPRRVDVKLRVQSNPEGPKSSFPQSSQVSEGLLRGRGTSGRPCRTRAHRPALASPRIAPQCRKGTMASTTVVSQVGIRRMRPCRGVAGSDMAARTPCVSSKVPPPIAPSGFFPSTRALAPDAVDPAPRAGSRVCGLPRSPHLHLDMLCRVVSFQMPPLPPRRRPLP